MKAMKLTIAILGLTLFGLALSSTVHAQTVQGYAPAPTSRVTDSCSGGGYTFSASFNGKVDRDNSKEGIANCHSEFDFKGADGSDVDDTLVIITLDNKEDVSIAEAVKSVDLLINGFSEGGTPLPPDCAECAILRSTGTSTDGYPWAYARFVVADADGIGEKFFLWILVLDPTHEAVVMTNAVPAKHNRCRV